MRHDFYGAKYTVIFDEKTGHLHALRNGEPWDRSLSGDGLVLAMLQRVDAQQKLLDRALGALSDAQLWITGMAEDDSTQAFENLSNTLGKLANDIVKEHKEATDPTA